MRILKYALLSMVVVLLSFIVFFVITQEVLIFIAGNQIKSVLQSFKTAPSVQLCQPYLSQFSSNKVDVAYQIRFISDTQYVSEAICKPFNTNTQELEQHTLPQFITKIPGSSGIIWQNERSGVGIKAFDGFYNQVKTVTGIDISILQRQKFIFVEDQTIISEQMPESYGETPVAACQGYGYKCCDSIAEIGIGDQLLNTNNCEKSCFSACIRRPVVLSFMSDPFPDPQTRTVIVTPDTFVEFQYLIDDYDAESTAVTINFGDGNQEEIAGATGSTQHTYTCTTKFCTYTATITANDSNQRTSVSTQLSTLKIEVRR